MTETRRAPGPHRPLAGNLRAAVHDSISLYEDATRDFGGILRFGYAIWPWCPARKSNWRKRCHFVQKIT